MPTTTDHPQREVSLAIGGMTCASCSSRIERKLNKIEGVQASVNLATEKATVRYAASVDPGVLVAAVEATGYTASVVSAASTDREVTSDERSVGRRAVIAAALALPVLVLAMGPWPDFAARPWLELALSTPVVFWAAWPFHRAAAVNARHGASTMDTLVSLGVLAAYGWSTATVLTGSDGHLYFEVAAVVTTFLLAGRWMEAHARSGGRAALESLLHLGAKDVAVQRIDSRTRVTTEVRVPVTELRVGDHFVVRPGEKIATDGVILEGTSAIDASLVTGESVPVDVSPGDEVTGATLNTHGRLVIEARRVGSETTLATITRLVEQAQTGSSPTQRLADRISAVFVPVVLSLAALTFLGWWAIGGDVSRALEVGISVLIIACPCALGLATPTALLAGTGRGAQLGVLIKGPEVLEDTRRVDTLVLDKTGTVTTGVARLSDVRPAGRLSATAALRAAAAVEAGSEHPVALAVVRAARERGLEIPPVEGFRALPGSGAVGTVNGTEVTIGTLDLFDVVPAGLEGASRPGTTVYVGWGGSARAALTVADEVRATSRAAVERLQGQGLTVHLLTGDAADNARDVAAAVGIDPARVRSGVRPADKHAVIRELQSQGHVVAMVGDGINDAAALAQADLGLAMGTGTDAAADSADIVLLRPELPAVADAIDLSRQTLRVIKQNLTWAFGYNAAAIPLAMGGVLNPMIAGGAMAASSVIVVTNSLRLRGAVHR